MKAIFGGWLDWFTGLGDIFSNAGAGLIDAFWAGIQAAWGRLQEGFSGLLEGLRDLLPFSDAAEGPLSELTKSGRSLLPTFASGIAQTADAPVAAVSNALGSIALQAPRIPPVQMEAPGRPAVPGRSAEAAGDDSGGVDFQRGAFQITISGANAIDDLEDRLTDIFSRAALRLGVSHG